MSKVIDDWLNTIWHLLPLQFIIVGIILVSALIIGFFVERVVYSELNREAARRRQRSPRILLRNLRGETLVWFILASAYVIVRSHLLDINPSVQSRIFQTLQVILIVSVTWFLLQVALSFIDYYTRRGSLPKTSIFPNITRLVVLSIAAVAVLNTFGISVSPILAALGVGGLAIALALQDTLANLFAGISILTARQVNPGDYIELSSGEVGYVDDVSWRNTTILSIDNATIIVPNKNLGALIVTNYSLPVTELNLRIPVSVSYESDLNQVEEVAIKTARDVLNEVEGGVANVAPYVRFIEFGESSINFNVILRIRSYADLRLIRHEFIKLLHMRFNRKGINIPYPIRTVYLKQDSEQIGNTKEDASKK